MIQIADKSQCCGCTACVVSCPVQCIVMRRDREGFDYPFANPDRCIGCGRCEQVCPMDKAPEAVQPSGAWAAAGEGDTSSSSSGGVFPVLASHVIAEGGVVFGAAFEDARTVGHSEVCDLSALENFKGSKYVQSDLYSCFEEVRDHLKTSRKVLFSGTPCQIAGLRSFLGGGHEFLVCVDCACHGVPGPGLWAGYVDALEKKYGASVTKVNFRDKSSGWKRYCICISLSDGRTIRTSRDRDPYMALFLQDVTLRPSCYHCPFRGLRSGSDITLADLWTADRVAPGMDSDKGISLVIANSSRGVELVEKVQLKRKPLDWKIATEGNGGFRPAADVPDARHVFFNGLSNAPDLIRYMKRFVVRKPLPVRMYRSLHTFLSKVRSALSGTVHRK